MRAALSRFWHDESGATAIEYALLGTLIAVAIVGTFAAVGENVAAVFGFGTGGPTDIIGNAAAGL